MENENRNPRKVIYMALAVLVSVALWLYVDIGGAGGQPQTEEKWFNDIPIEYTFAGTGSLADRGLMLVEENTDTTVDLLLEGTRWNIARLTADDIRITADLSGVTNAGRQMVAYQITYSNSKFDNVLQEKSRSISRATVNIAELYSKQIEIKCEVVGSLADGCLAGQVQMSQTQLEIRGQYEDISAVTYAKVTLDIGEDVESSVTQTLGYQLYDVFDKPVDNTKIYPTADLIKVTLPVSIQKELKLNMHFLDAPGMRLKSCDWSIQPSSIVVSGDAAQLRNIEEIVLNDFDLLTVDDNVTTYSYPIVIPDGCRNLSGITQAILQISRKDYAEANLAVGNFQFNNLPTDKTVEVLTEDLTARLFGTINQVANLKPDDLTAVVDLGDFVSANGQYTVPVILESSYGDIGFIGAYEIQIRIRDVEDAPQEGPSVGEDVPEA